MAGGATQWWEDPETDWGAGDPARVVDVLTYAYATLEDARRIGLEVGLDWSRAPAAASLRETWTWALRQAAAAGRTLDLAAVVLHDRDASAFHAPLSDLLRDRLGAAYTRLSRRYGLPPAPSAGADVMVDTIVAAEPSGELQAYTSSSDGFEDPRPVVQAITDLEARTALIEVAGVPAGTGFLVGDDLVLTAAHVFDRHVWPPKTRRSAVVVFDFAPAPGRSYFQTGTRVPVRDYVTGSLPSVAEASGTVSDDDWDAPDDRLDFALLKLATAVPRAHNALPRGHYELLPDDYDFHASARYMIMEHPAGGYVKLTHLNAPPLVSPRRTRIRYGGNTFQGASGSAVVDYRGRLVALHHYTGGGRNQGVPISLIAQALLESGYAGLFQNGGPVAPSAAVTQIDPFATLAVLGRRPFVNRDPLRTAMRAMAERKDTVRTLAIKGESGTGVSYSYQLASHVAAHSTLCPELRATAPGGLKAVRIDLRGYLKLGVDRVRTEIGVKLLMDLEIIDTPADELAQAARDTIRLVAMLEAKLRRCDEQWWLFFDSLDSLVTVKQGDVDELLHALIVLADDPQVPLRIVLAGRAAEEFATAHTAWAERDRASALTRGDVESWLRLRAKEDARTIDEAKLQAKLAELFPAPGSLPDPSDLAPTLPNVLLEVLQP